MKVLQHPLRLSVLHHPTTSCLDPFLVPAGAAGSGFVGPTASVVRSNSLRKRRFWRAERLTLTGSMIYPMQSLFTHSPVAALETCSDFGIFKRSITIDHHNRHCGQFGAAWMAKARERYCVGRHPPQSRAATEMTMTELYHLRQRSLLQRLRECIRGMRYEVSFLSILFLLPGTNLMQQHRRQFSQTFL